MTSSISDQRLHGLGIQRSLLPIPTPTLKQPSSSLEDIFEDDVENLYLTNDYTYASHRHGRSRLSRIVKSLFTITKFTAKFTLALAVVLPFQITRLALLRIYQHCRRNRTPNRICGCASERLREWREEGVWGKFWLWVGRVLGDEDGEEPELALWEGELGKVEDFYRAG